MINTGIKNNLDPLLKQLATEKSFDIAEKITAELAGLLQIKTTNRFLVNIPRVDAELARFQLAPGFARQAAAYELPQDNEKPFDLKLFWIKKTTKSNLSWIIGLTPNFEDAESNDYKNIGIDFVVPETCDSIIVLLSNKFKVRALELKDHITPTQLEILSQWQEIGKIGTVNQNESKKVLHSRLWESFNFEPINRKFYLELVEHFSILVHHLEKYFDRKPAVMFTTRLIGRLLFIWFLKKKNLINASVDYFSVSDVEKQTDYYKDQLEKLFFEVLNRDKIERNNGDKLTPYLNGGLFDKNTTDFYGNPKLTFPNGYFNQLFETLNKYNFTVDESSPEFQHVAIDPEMLGRIFESLLAEQIDENTGNSKKKATGAVYTPREIVSYMCEQSLIEHLKISMPDSPDRDRRLEELIKMPEAIFRDQDQNKRRDWKPYRESIIGVLEGKKNSAPLTILDPAVGSGAFPMGMLHLLIKVYSRLDPKFEKDISGLKRNILSRSLYGVDIEQTAIEITRLRAWLSIIVDIPENEKIEPLPNLDFKFVCANTLIPLDEDKQATFFSEHDLKDKLIYIRNEYFKTSSKAKKEKLQNDYLKLTQKTSLFDSKKAKQLKSYRPFDIGSSSEFYDSELMHGVGSFDIVIGNPPYVFTRDAGFSKEFKKIIDQTYSPLLTKNAHKSKANQSGKINLFALFILRGNLLCSERGILNFIMPNNILRTTTYDLIRKYLLEKTQIQEIVDLGGGVFDGITASTIILRTVKKQIQPNHKISVITNIKNIESSDYQLSYIDQDKFIHNISYTLNIFGDETTVSLLSKINSHKTRLGEYCSEIIEGIVAHKHLIKEQPSQNTYPLIEGKTIKRFYLLPVNKYIIWDVNKIHRTRPESLWNSPKKILIQRISGGNSPLRATLDENKYKTFASVNNLVLKNNYENLYEFFLALINSRVMNWFYANSFSNNSKLTVNISKTFLEQLPIELGNDDIRKNISEITKSVLLAKKNNANADIEAKETEIDNLIFKLYGLNESEIQIIKNSHESGNSR